MKRTPGKLQQDLVLPRSEKHFHVIVTREMHETIKIYAAKYGISLFSATTRLLRLGLGTELNHEDSTLNAEVDKIRKMITELAEQELTK